MTDYLDAIVLTTDPAALDGLTVHRGPSDPKHGSLAFVRATEDELAALEKADGVTILARVTYDPGAPDAVYEALAKDGAAMEVYAQAYPRTPIVVGEGKDSYELVPPFAFGRVA